MAFRWFARENARELGVRGYVRNLPDGRVEVVAEGGREDVELFRRRLREGPRFAVVAGLEESEVEPSGSYKEFSVTYQDAEPGRRQSRRGANGATERNHS